MEFEPIQPTIAVTRGVLYARWSIGHEGHQCMGPIGVSRCTHPITHATMIICVCDIVSLFLCACSHC